MRSLRSYRTKEMIIRKFTFGESGKFVMGDIGLDVMEICIRLVCQLISGIAVVEFQCLYTASETTPDCSS